MMMMPFKQWLALYTFTVPRSLTPVLPRYKVNCAEVHTSLSANTAQQTHHTACCYSPPLGVCLF
ncbi:hypothetical protein PGIGA_G00010410 [Pangasianodon gigas]|uniref:Uncharacterized protein n=1 Tax=Pangasianodon gigas TaxID=30993 RepID=A0ACC5W8X9_PANGG|nr:hypothetical protein [Pangasianodon gigas]